MNLPCCCLNHTREEMLQGAFESETTMLPIGNSVHFTSKKWQNPEITYAWLNRTAEIEEYVNAWIDYINTHTGITLRLIDDYKKSDMRFDTDPSQGGRSFFGNDALKIQDKQQWTTNFGFEEIHPVLKQTTPQMDWWKIARISNHELAHAVFSQRHEQFHPDVKYSEYDRTYRLAQGVPSEEIDRHYALKQVINQSSDPQASKVGDPESVSLYPIHVMRLAPQSRAFGYEDSDRVKINYGISKGDHDFWVSEFPLENTPVQPVENCVDDFDKATIRKKLREIDNILKRKS